VGKTKAPSAIIEAEKERLLRGAARLGIAPKKKKKTAQGQRQGTRQGTVIGDEPVKTRPRAPVAIIDNAGEQLLRVREVRALTGLGRSTIYPADGRWPFPSTHQTHRRRRSQQPFGMARV
jgi:hypothetical protein